MHLLALARLVKTGPVQRGALHIKPAQTLHHLLPIGTIVAQARQQQAGRRGRGVLRFENLLHHPQEGRLGADLDQEPHAVGAQRRDAIGKAHRIAQMAPPIGGIGQFCCHQRPRHAGNNRDLRRS